MGLSRVPGAHLEWLEPLLTKSTSASKASEKIRPGAGGHRFGPELQCGECGRNWDDHQRDPSPCTHESGGGDVLAAGGHPVDLSKVAARNVDPSRDLDEA